MDLHVVPPTGYEEDEVYKVSVKQYSKPEQGVFFLSFIRESRYNKFDSCVDKSVDIKLCGCAKEQITDVTKKGVLFENGVSTSDVWCRDDCQKPGLKLSLVHETKLRNVFVCVGSGEYNSDRNCSAAASWNCGTVAVNSFGFHYPEEFRPDKAGTEQIVRHYGQPGRVENRTCDETHYPDICSFQVTESDDNKLSCDAKVCGSSDAQIASVNPEMGKAVSDWKPLPKDTMTATVKEAIKTNLEKGFSFLFIRCGSIFQALTFPPILKKVEDGKKRSDRISIETLPRAVEAFKKINEDPNIKATAMDFELVQSIGQQTFENLRPFFSSVLKDDNEIGGKGENILAPLGTEVMYGTFQKWGYQTLFQEDLCWYDIWGIMLTEIQRRAMISGDSELKSRWMEFQEKVAKKKVDHYGLTHFSCTVLVNKLRRTNHYDYPEKVCFNGQFFSWYFMDYITKLYTSLKNDEKAKPMFSYTHFNTGHATTGKRIINLDANLAKFFINMAAFPNTLTVIFADHGHTRTPFSSTEEGRRELFDPSFFMIVPDGVAEKLGSQRMAALVENQKRLFILLDVHKAFMSLNDPDKMKLPGVFGNRYIFSDTSKPHMRRLVHAAADQVQV
ncbi:ligand-gated sodium channel [Desmophyllum pertusum]|uniref:Ligand-gated sodium channel n=1 Tax=Desmophyllum pertusum TaxID=174260 RepID=A0A9W9ZWX4_9CNID|nr:ligand-gated sodium channel [Desmophyllum pertusum]